MIQMYARWQLCMCVRVRNVWKFHTRSHTQASNISKTHAKYAIANLNRILIRVIFLNYVQTNQVCVARVRSPALLLWLRNAVRVCVHVLVFVHFILTFSLNRKCSCVHRVPRLTTIIIRYAAVTIAVLYFFRRSFVHSLARSFVGSLTLNAVY